MVPELHAAYGFSWRKAAPRPLISRQIDELFNIRAQTRGRLRPLSDPALGAIADQVSEVFGLPSGAIVSKSRAQRTAFIRQIAIYLCRQISGQSFPLIARHFGRHHATAIYACRLVEQRMARQPAFRRFMERMERAIAGTVLPSGESCP